MKKLIAFVFSLVFLLIVLDQATKLAIYHHFDVKHIGSEYYYVQNPDSEIMVIGNLVKFVYVENAGMALGIQFGSLKIFLTLFSLFASIVLSYIIIKIINTSPKVVVLAFALILAGAVGNLIDRMFYGVLFGYGKLLFGRVIDFIQVDIPDISIGSIHYTHFPVFNCADSYVTIGVVLLLIFNKHLPSFSSIFRLNFSRGTDGFGQRPE